MIIKIRNKKAKIFYDNNELKELETKLNIG